MKDWALVLRKEGGYQSIKSNKMIMTIQCDTTQFAVGKIIPIVIQDDVFHRTYQITEAKVIAVSLLTIDVEVHVKQTSRNPTFDLKYIDCELIPCKTIQEARCIHDYLFYIGLESLHIGSHYRR